MDAPLPDWWTHSLLHHPLAASHVVDAGPRWAPTPAPAPRIEALPSAFSVTWELSELAANELEIEIVAGMLVLRARSDDQVYSRAIPVPEDVDLSRRRDHWSREKLEVVVPRIRPTVWGRVRHFLAQILRRIATWVAPE